MAMVSVKDKYSSQVVPRDRFGNELLVSDGNGGTYGEMTVQVVDDESVDRMMLAYALARAETTKSGPEIIAECKEYLDYIRQSEQALEGQHPKFSNMIDRWVEGELAEKYGADSAVSDLDAAQMYDSLRSEMYDDYQEAIKAGDLQALAEWDAVSAIIEKRIEECFVLSMMTQTRERYGLAA